METLGGQDFAENQRIVTDENTLKALSEKEETLTQFSPEEQREIETKRRILSSLAYFIGKDFQIPVELNEPGAGWHWDFLKNIIRVDPKDLLEKPMDYLRFVISHEGGHRRISRTEFVPLEVWKRPGFSFMMNAIEDPRDNNFVAENYPKFREQMRLAYEMNLDLENKSKEKAQAKLGYQPRFMQAGFEYIKQWFLDQADGYEISGDLPDEVKKVVQDTLSSARSSWTTYPSRGGADGKESERTTDGRTVSGEELISEYAKASYQINLERVWPEFRKLVEKDMEDQRTQELLDEMQSASPKATADGQDQPENGSKGLPQELSDRLIPEEQEELEKAIDEAIEKAKQEPEQKDQNGEPSKEQSDEPGEATSEEAGESSEQPGQKGRPIDLNSLSPELRQKIKDYIDSLPDDKKKELAEKAQKSISDFEKELDEELGGKLSDNPENVEERREEGQKSNNAGGEPLRTGLPRENALAIEKALKYKERIDREVRKDANIYEQVRREVLPLIDKLENELRAIFRERRVRRWESGRKSGPSISIKHRIAEIAQGIPAIDSRAWQKREKPQERDYAISLLVDLSGSMWRDKKSLETFKAAIVLAEVLNRLSINIEILGFNDQVYEYQQFNEEMSNEIREHMGGMLQEVEDSRCKNCGNEHSETDLGWATEIAVDRLSKQKAENKFLITLSDGKLEESDKHPKVEFDLNKVIGEILKQRKVRLIGLGVGKGTKLLENYYPNSVTDINVEEMAEKLAAVIREAVEHYEKF